MHRFVAAILQVDRLGIPVSSVLREQASEMRAKRRARAREQAQKVPVKILMPLMLCLLPGLFIIILGPAVLTMVDTLGG
jgi:tight adherence protein C